MTTAIDTYDEGLGRCAKTSATYMPPKAYCTGWPICHSVIAVGIAIAISDRPAVLIRFSGGTQASISSTAQTATSSAISGAAAQVLSSSGFIGVTSRGVCRG